MPDTRLPVQVLRPCSERHDPEAQDEFREDAHQLLQNILEKNNEADNRKVSPSR